MLADLILFFAHEYRISALMTRLVMKVLENFRVFDVLSNNVLGKKKISGAF